MTIRPDWPRCAPVAFDNTVRLIPGQHTEGIDHALADLADDDDEVDALVQLSAATNPRLQAQEERHPGGLDRTDMVFDVPFSRIVNGAFANPGEGARFHGPDGRGIWYCALSDETCLKEVVHHRIRHLAETGLDSEEDIRYRLYFADIHGQDFYWLDDGSQDSLDCLDPSSYAASQRLGAEVLERSGGGVVYPSVRHAEGTCIAVFQGPIVGNVRQGDLYTLTITNGLLTNVTTSAP